MFLSARVLPLIVLVESSMYYVLIYRLFLAWTYIGNLIHKQHLFYTSGIMQNTSESSVWMVGWIKLLFLPSNKQVFLNNLFIIVQHILIVNCPVKRRVNAQTKKVLKQNQAFSYAIHIEIENLSSGQHLIFDVVVHMFGQMKRKFIQGILCCRKFQMVSPIWSMLAP